MLHYSGINPLTPTPIGIKFNEKQFQIVWIYLHDLNKSHEPKS